MFTIYLLLSVYLIRYDLLNMHLFITCVWFFLHRHSWLMQIVFSVKHVSFLQQNPPNIGPQAVSLNLTLFSLQTHLFSKHFECHILSQSSCVSQNLPNAAENYKINNALKKKLFWSFLDIVKLLRSKFFSVHLNESSESTCLQ